MAVLRGIRISVISLREAVASIYQRLYRLVTDSSGDEILDGREVPENFFRLLVARRASKIADRLASPKTTLAWLLQALGAPALFVGIIVPLRESGSLLPQAFLGNYLKRFPVRKWAWTLGAVLQGVAIAGCGLVALTMTGAQAGVAIVGLLVAFSLARGISSVSAKDVLGKTIPKSKRGQLTGWAGSASGIIAIVAASLLFFVDEGASIRGYALYLGAAAVCWWLAAIVHARVVEPEGEVEKGKPLGEGLMSQFGLLKRDSDFRNFLIVRSLAIGSGLSTPFVIALAHDRLGGAAIWLGVFIIVEGFAATVTGPVWGRWADRSSRSVLRGSMALVSVLLIAVIGFAVADSIGDWSRIFFPVILFLLGAAHAGVRVGRKTYIVDMAEGNKRTDYVSVGNTFIGVLLLIAGVLTGLASLISVPVALAIFAGSSAVGALYGSRLPQVS